MALLPGQTGSARPYDRVKVPAAEDEKTMNPFSHRALFPKDWAATLRWVAIDFFFLGHLVSCFPGVYE